MKKLFWSQIWAKAAKIRLKLGFLHFSQVWFINFLEIVCNYNLEQFLTSGRGKTYKKSVAPNLGQNRAKSGRKLVFFTIFSSLFH